MDGLFLLFPGDQCRIPSSRHTLYFSWRSGRALGLLGFVSLTERWKHHDLQNQSWLFSTRNGSVIYFWHTNNAFKRHQILVLTNSWGSEDERRSGAAQADFFCKKWYPVYASCLCCWRINGSGEKNIMAIGWDIEAWRSFEATLPACWWGLVEIILNRIRYLQTIEHLQWTFRSSNVLKLDDGKRFRHWRMTFRW